MSPVSTVRPWPSPIPIFDKHFRRPTLGGRCDSTWTRVMLCSGIMLPGMIYRTASQGELDLCPCVSSSCAFNGLVISSEHRPSQFLLWIAASSKHFSFTYTSAKCTSLPFSFLVLPLRLLPTITQKLTNGFVFFIGAFLGPWQRRMSVGERLPVRFRMIKERAVSISDKIMCSQSRNLFSLAFLGH
jgi:hypothetical protein